MPIIETAPIIGHGTGSIAEEFRRIAAGNTGAAAMPAVNPYNQTFAGAIQLGLLGAAVLWAMWIAHVALFTGPSAFAWLGWSWWSGWLYVFSVGLFGGTILGERDRVSKSTFGG